MISGARRKFLLKFRLELRLSQPAQSPQTNSPAISTTRDYAKNIDFHNRLPAVYWRFGDGDRGDGKKITGIFF